MFKHSEKGSWLSLLGTLAVAVTLTFSAPLFAQSDEAEEDDEDEPYVAPKREEITVTGSRIKRNEFSSTAPIEVITTDKTALAGLLNASDILQNSTVASGGQQINDSFSGFVTDGGPGANSVSLRGLGAQRTLVLVNGKRWGPSGVRGSTNSVDLTAIPNAQISRYEILKDGASSVYGADAVAGVVNAITKERQDGGQMNATLFAPADGGANGVTVGGTWGTVGDNWSFSVAGNYSFRQELNAADRDFSECPRRIRFTDQFGDGNIDNTDPDSGERLCFGFIYGLAVSPFGFARFDPTLQGAGLDPSNPNFDGTINGAFGIPNYTTVPENSLDNSGEFYRDTRSPSNTNIVPQSTNVSLNSFGDIDFEIAGRSATAYYEMYSSRRSSDIDTGIGQFFPLVPATNPTNPFGTNGPLAGFGGFAARPVLAQYWRDPTTSVGVTRSNTFLGLKGDISETWTYEGYVGYGHSRGTYKSQNLLANEVAQSIDAVFDGAGNVVCRDQSNGCVAENLFSAEAMLNGTLSQDYLDFITKNTVGETRYFSHQAAAYVTGDLFDMWAGTVAAVFGAEVRREEIADIPDEAAIANNIFNRTSAGVTAGSDVVREAFVEVEIPLLNGYRFAEDLSLNVSSRYTDYNSFGDDTTTRFALNYQITPSIRIRGTKGESFRAPDLFEQFLGDQTGFVDSFGNDPCLNLSQGALGPGDAIYDNCVAQGIDPLTFGNNGATSITTITGGASDLAAETSDSWTMGIILQPENTGASVAVNWFEIEINDTVARPSVGFILDECYSSPGLTNPFCSRVAARDSQGFLTTVNSSRVNVGVQRTKGIDFDILWQKEFETFDLSIDVTATRIEEQFLELFGTEFNLEGQFGTPQWSANADVQLDYRDWTFNWRVNWIGNQATQQQFDPGTTNVDRPFQTGHFTSNNVSVRYTANDWQVIGTVTNLLDAQPPILGSSGDYGNVDVNANIFFNTLPGVGYDLLGRSFILQFSRGF